MSIFDNHQFFMDMCSLASKRNAGRDLTVLGFNFEDNEYHMRFNFDGVGNNPSTYRVKISLYRVKEYSTRYLFELEMNFGWKLMNYYFVPENVDMVYESSVPDEEIEDILTYMKLTI